MCSELSGPGKVATPGAVGRKTGPRARNGGSGDPDPADPRGSPDPTRGLTNTQAQALFHREVCLCLCVLCMRVCPVCVCVLFAYVSVCPAEGAPLTRALARSSAGDLQTHSSSPVRSWRHAELLAA